MFFLRLDIDKNLEMPVLEGDFEENVKYPVNGLSPIKMQKLLSSSGHHVNHTAIWQVYVLPGSMQR